MAFVHIPRRRKSLFGGIFAIVCLYWLVQQHELVKDRITTSVVDASCSEALARLEQRPNRWPTTPSFDGETGDDVVETLFDLRDFEKCVMLNGALDGNRMETIQKRLFPYLNLDLLYTDEKKFWPVHSRSNGESVKGSTPRFSDGDHKFLGFSKIKYDQKLSFWGNWLQVGMQPGSRGIIISAGVEQLEDCARLLRVLRHLGNTLPIEVVHRGDISSNQQKFLFEIAAEKASSLSPAQDLWFLDVSSMLNPIYADHFKTFSNKWLALLFSSFENPVLLDADTIPFTSLEVYYDSQQYKTTGTAFFKDRKVKSDLFTKDQLGTLRRLFSNLTEITLSEGETDDNMRDSIKTKIKDDIAGDTIYGLIVKGQKHHMESGLVVIDKRQHLTDLLSSVALQFSSVSKYLHGDKEWFWIGQALQNHQFTFHPIDASNVGELGKVVSQEKLEFFQLCSAQLSHTDVDGSLLWINGGLKRCKKDSWASDFKDNQRIASMFDNEDEVREYYQSPVKLDGGIIPDVEITPWLMTGECAMFNYCTLYKEGEYGEVIKFTEPQKTAYAEIVDVWNLAIDGIEAFGLAAK